jgi:hypothetical protein
MARKTIHFISHSYHCVRLIHHRLTQRTHRREVRRGGGGWLCHAVTTRESHHSVALALLYLGCEFGLWPVVARVCAPCRSDTARISAARSGVISLRSGAFTSSPMSSAPPTRHGSSSSTMARSATVSTQHCAHRHAAVACRAALCCPSALTLTIDLCRVWIACRWCW